MRAAVVAGLLVATVLATAVALAAVPVTRISSDPYTDSGAAHKTQVEPDTYSFGSTIVSAFQTGRAPGGGASNIGWATSTDGGDTWTKGFLPGITKLEGGIYDRVTDPAVAYDRKHDAWLISTLALIGGSGRAILTSRSTDGGLTWSDPFVVSTTNGFYDKNWIACDTTPSSRFYGRCYTEWDDVNAGGRILMSTSADGGRTWGPPKPTKDFASGVGGQPIVQPNGTVVVPIGDGGLGSILAFRSKNGGASWSRTVRVASIIDHGVAGGVRIFNLPSVEIDKAGKLYVAWQDCRFRSGCSSNDIVMTTSMDGKTWSPVTRIPIDPVSSTVDHFTPGLGVDRATKGGSARLGVQYHYYPNANCDSSTCRLYVGFVSSGDGGATWSAPQELAGPMQISWLPPTSSGRMFGDYMSTSWISSKAKAYPVFPIAKAPTEGVFDQAMHAPANGLPVGRPVTSVTARDRQPVPDAASDRAPLAGPVTVN